MLKDYLIKTKHTFIPYTNIVISVTGENNADLLYFVNKNNEKALITDFWVNKKEYTLAKVLALSFKPVNIPFNNFDDIDVDFIDGNKQNLDLNNLIWRFNKLIESKRHNGFYHIPGFTRSLISLDGRCINTYRNTILATDLVDGYLTVRVYSDHKKERTRTTIHRLICLTFLGYPVNVDSLEVNHKDGNKLNNSLENLEWVTHARNMKHAKETNLITCNIPFLTRNVLTEEIKEYYSTTDYERETGVNRSLVSKRLSYKDQPVFSDNLQYKRKDDLTPWRKVINLNLEQRRAGFTRPILVKNIFTDEILSFKNVSEAEQQLNIGKTRLLMAFKLKPYTPFKSFLFKDISDKTPWVNYQKELLDLFKLNNELKRSNNSMVYKVTDLKTNEVKFYYNQIEIDNLNLDFNIIKVEKINLNESSHK